MITTRFLVALPGLYHIRVKGVKRFTGISSRDYLLNRLRSPVLSPRSIQQVA